MLRQGITGFFDQDGGHSLPEVPAAQFKTACYAAAREVGATLEGFTPSGVTPNFHRALLDRHDSRLPAVCNAIYPVVGFARPSPEGQPLEFLDHPAFAAAFEASGFEVASAAALTCPLGAAELAVLGEAVRNQIAYWRAATVGEVIFNWFD